MEEQELAGQRPDPHGLPRDMPVWMARLIVAIDTFSIWVGKAVAWLTVPLMLSMAYEVLVRYLFAAPSIAFCCCGESDFHTSPLM